MLFNWRYIWLAQRSITISLFTMTLEEMRRLITDAGYTPAMRRQDYSLIPHPHDPTPPGDVGMLGRGVVGVEA